PLMAQYEYSVRPGAERASVLGSPDVRLHLPKHWAIASWLTPEGRAQPFVAQTIPLRTNPERIARHHAAQAARGGRLLERFHQPHWDRDLDDAGEQVLPPTASAAAPAQFVPAEPDAPPSRPAQPPSGPADEPRAEGNGDTGD